MGRSIQAYLEFLFNIRPTGTGTYIVVLNVVGKFFLMLEKL